MGMTQFIAHTQEITMRAATSLRLLLVPAALLASACDYSSSPLAPEELPVAEAEAPDAERTTGPLEDLAYWADGYLWAATVGGTVTPVSNASFNRSGGAITVTKVAGTTGRYLARFRGLSGLLGGKSTVHVTGTGAKLGASYCKPVGGFLVRDSVEVHCCRMGTGAAVNHESLDVLGKRDDQRAFAFANQPTATNYAPASAGSSNPAGATRVYRDGVGGYRVVFTGLGARLPAGVGGHVQVNAVGTNKVHCKINQWGGSTDLSVTVACYSGGGPGGREVRDALHAAGRPPGLRLGRPADLSLTIPIPPTARIRWAERWSSPASRWARIRFAGSAWMPRSATSATCR